MWLYGIGRGVFVCVCWQQWQNEGAASEVVWSYWTDKIVTGTVLHSTLSIEPLYEFIYRSSEFFRKCSTHQNPLIQQIGDYDTVELQQRYKKKYIHKRTKHLLL
jgi:hypothetical protein